MNAGPDTTGRARLGPRCVMRQPPDVGRKQLRFRATQGKTLVSSAMKPAIAH
jgi:hypothetical protein